jgi:hypothetical protein
MGVSMVIGGSADNTNANAARIARNASAGESWGFGRPAHWSQSGWSAPVGPQIRGPSILRDGRKQGWSAPKTSAHGRKRFLRPGRNRRWSAPSRQRKKKPLPHQWEGRVTLSAISLLRCVKGQRQPLLSLTLADSHG